MTRYPHGWRCVRAFPLHHRAGRLTPRRIPAHPGRAPRPPHPTPTQQGDPKMPHPRRRQPRTPGGGHLLHLPPGKVAAWADHDPRSYHAAVRRDALAAIDQAAARRRSRTDVWLNRAHAALWAALAVWLVTGLAWWAVAR